MTKTEKLTKFTSNFLFDYKLKLKIRLVYQQFFLQYSNSLPRRAAAVATRLSKNKIRFR